MIIYTNKQQPQETETILLLHYVKSKWVSEWSLTSNYSTHNTSLRIQAINCTGTNTGINSVANFIIVFSKYIYCLFVFLRLCLLSTILFSRLLLLSTKDIYKLGLVKKTQKQAKSESKWRVANLLVRTAYERALWLARTVVHNTSQNSSDNLPYYPPDYHYSSDDVYWWGTGYTKSETDHKLT